MVKPPLSFFLLRIILILAKPFYGFIFRQIEKSNHLEGTMGPREMSETIPPPRQPSIWLHAVSVGEMEAAFPIIREIINQTGPDRLLVTTTSREGYAVAQKKIENFSNLQYFPFDIPNVISRFLYHYKPSLYICMETELWPNLTYELKKQGIPMIFANGRISDRLKNTPSMLRPVFKWMFASYNWIGLQTDEDLRRLKTFSKDIQNAEVVGNTKFDLPDPRPAPEEIEKLRHDTGLNNGPVIVIGSTHPGEEEIIADVFCKLKREYSDISMILAPRHIERTDDVEKILDRAGITYNLRTDTSNGKLSHQKVDCLLLNTVGELTRMYALGDVAFVGGSLIKRGGHNLLEPAAAGVPVLHGPYMDNFRAITSFLHNADAAIEVENGESLRQHISQLLMDRNRLNVMRENALNAYQKGKGATEKIMLKVKEYMP